MIVSKNTRLLDLIVTAAILIVGVIGLLQSLGFSGRVGMWPSVVMITLVLSVGFHFTKLLREIIDTKPPEHSEIRSEE